MMKRHFCTPWALSAVLLLAAIPGFLSAQETCPVGSILSQTPTLPAGGPRIWVSDDAIGPGNSTMPAPYDNFTAADPIGAVQWWGVEMNAGTFLEGARLADTFTVTFYDNDTSGVDPMPGTVVCQHVVTATKEATAIVYPNPYVPGESLTLRRYHATLPTPCTVGTGWVSIRGTAAGSANGVLFLQLSASDGDQTMREYNGTNLPYRVRNGVNYDIAWCLVKSVTVPDVAGMTQANAEAALIAAELTVGAVTYDYSGTFAADQVISQNPSDGASVLPGSPVDLVVSADPPGALGMQPPTLPTGGPRIWVSDDAIGPGNSTMPAPYDNVAVVDPIGAVVWWGVEMNAGTFLEGARLADSFTITFYDNDTSGADPMPGTAVCQHAVIAEKEATAIVYPNPYVPGETLTLRRYSATLPTPCTVGTGWVSIRGVASGSANGVLFLQLSSSHGDQTMREYNGTNLPYRVRNGVNYDIACYMVKSVVVPDVIGMTQANAEAAIAAAELSVGEITYDYSGTFAPGYVVGQDPDGGDASVPNMPVDLVVSAVASGALVSQSPTLPVAGPRIWVSDDAIGPGNGTMPAPYDDFVTADPVGAVQWWGVEMNAGTFLEGTRLANSFTITFYDNDTSGADPMPGTVVCQHVVTAAKEATVIVYPNPYVPGETLTLQRYDAVLPAPCTAGTGWISIRGVAAGSANGVLFLQLASSNGNSTMREYNGTNLPYRVRNGVNYDIAYQLMQAISVPDVSGMTQANAEVALVAAGFTVGTITYDYSGTGVIGEVISQDPAAGQFAVQGAPVSLLVAADPATLTVPDVVGMAQGAAESAIIAAGLTVGTITYDYSGIGVVGEVLSQLPAGGQFAAPGTPVNLVVAAAPLVVPNLIGMLQADAETMIVAESLVVGTITEAYSDIVPVGSVVSHTPAEGATVAPGTAIDLVISLGPETVVPVSGVMVLGALFAALGALGIKVSRRRTND